MVPFSMLCSPQINLTEFPWLLRGIINYLIQSILPRRYQEMINEYPHLKYIFSEPPILSFRRNKNLQNWLVHSCLTKPTPNTHFTPGHSTPCSSKRGKGSKLGPAMSNTSSITDKLTNKSCLTSGGNATPLTPYMLHNLNTKHNLIYVGHSSQELSGRFNGHCSDVKVNPKQARGNPLGFS